MLAALSVRSILLKVVLLGAGDLFWASGESLVKCFAWMGLYAAPCGIQVGPECSEAAMPSSDVLGPKVPVRARFELALAMPVIVSGGPECGLQGWRAVCP